MSENNLSIQRLPVLAPQLVALVDAQIAAFFTMAQKFTAYSVTQTLRIANPMLEIAHDAVRMCVQQHMTNGTYASFPYTVTQEDWNGTEATTYTPTYAVISSTATPVSDPVLSPTPIMKIQNPQLGWANIDWPDDSKQ